MLKDTSLPTTLRVVSWSRLLPVKAGVVSEIFVVSVEVVVLVIER